MTTILEQLKAEIEAEVRASTIEEVRAAEFRADQAEYEVFLRAKYSTADKQAALKAGHAIANANGDPSYPVKDKEDLKNAIAAVGRGSADHDAIRQHIIKRATALGLASLIPDNWDTMTGALKDATQSNDADDEDIENRADDADTKQCPVCSGEGTIMKGNRECPACGGKKVVASDYEAKSSYLPVTAWVDQVTAEVTRNVLHAPDYRSVSEDAEERVNAAREQQIIREIMDMDEETREEMIEAAPDPDEIRSAIASYGDVENAVECALRSQFATGDDYCDLYVCDAGDVSDTEKWAVFTSYATPPGNGTFKVNFNCADDGAVTFTSNPVPVARVTTYEEIPAPKPVDLTATESVSRDADMLELEREAERDAEVRARAIVDVPAKRVRKTRSK